MGKRDWRIEVARWRDSGLSQSEYCRRNGMSPSSFHLHVKKLTNPEFKNHENADPEARRGFVRVGDYIELELADGVVARIPAREEMLKLLLKSSREGSI